MADQPKDTPPAESGRPTEVTWEGSKGRQPYANREEGLSPQDAFSTPAPGGDRGDASGVNQKEDEAVRGKP